MIELYILKEVLLGWELTSNLFYTKLKHYQVKPTVSDTTCTCTLFRITDNALAEDFQGRGLFLKVLFEGTDANKFYLVERTAYGRRRKEIGNWKNLGLSRSTPKPHHPLKKVVFLYEDLNIPSK